MDRLWPLAESLEMAMDVQTTHRVMDEDVRRLLVAISQRVQPPFWAEAGEETLQP